MRRSVRGHSLAAHRCAALFNLALCYERGEGIERDVPTAMGLYRKAAQGGNSGAMFNLGPPAAQGQPSVPSSIDANLRAHANARTYERSHAHRCPRKEHLRVSSVFMNAETAWTKTCACRCVASCIVT